MRREGSEPTLATTEDLHPGGPAAAEISTAVVRVLARYTGRGPTKARTYRGEDLVTVLLEETLTPGELTLVRSGRGELARDTRIALKAAARDELVAAVEDLTGQRVRTFLPATEVDPDISALVFVLARDAA